LNLSQVNTAPLKFKTSFSVFPEFDRIKKKEGKKRGESGKTRDFKKAWIKM